MAVDDLGERVGEIDVRIDAVELAGFDQRGDDRPVFSAAVGTGEERILAIKGDGSDRALDRVGVDLDSAVGEEPGKALPTRERIADRLGEFTFLADEAELLAQPRLEIGDERPSSGLANVAPLFRLSAANVVLVSIERRDALERFAGDR
jgi:hypothetical protein